MSTAYATGRLLVATPQIEDGVFYRSVVLVLHHDDDGAQGVVLNKPVDAEIESVLPGWGASAQSADTLFQGGPVGLDTALGLVQVWGQRSHPGIRRLFDGTGVIDLDSDPATSLAAVSALRIFVGYAGWSAGQLDEEISTGSWVVVDYHPEDAFGGEPDTLWSMVLARQPGRLSWLAWYPADPSLN